MNAIVLTTTQEKFPLSRRQFEALFALFLLNVTVKLVIAQTGLFGHDTQGWFFFFNNLHPLQVWT